MSIKDSRFLHPYYLLNVTLLLSYIVLRVKRLSPGALDTADMFGITRETQIYFCLALMLFTRLLSAPTTDAYLATAFMFCRVVVLLCLWYMSSRLLALFAALWTVLYVLIPPPRFRLSRSIATLNNVSFAQRVTNNKYKSFYVVWLHAPWSARCAQLVPVLSSLAMSYKHPRVIFARLDVSKYPDVAESLDVSISVASKQLPCVVCFKMGKEVARIPMVNERGWVEAKWSRGFTDKHVAQELGLNQFLQTAKDWEQEVKDKYSQKKAN